MRTLILYCCSALLFNSFNMDHLFDNYVVQEFCTKKKILLGTVMVPFMHRFLTNKLPSNNRTDLCYAGMVSDPCPSYH